MQGNIPVPKKNTVATIVNINSVSIDKDLD